VKTTALLATATLLAAPLTTVALAGSASAAPAAAAAPADREKRGTCAGGTYELQAEREDGGYEVTVDLDRLAPGSQWKVVLRHEGKRVAAVTRTADAEGDVELEAFRNGTPGAERFSFRATPVGGGKGCAATVRLA